MTSALCDFSARLKAADTGRAVWTASTARKVIRDDAIVLLVAAAVAEKRSPWVATIMGSSTTPIPTAKLPLHAKSRNAFWSAFGKEIADAIAKYHPADRDDKEVLPPQFVVATEKAWEQLLYGAARYAFDEKTTLGPRERRALKVLLWAEQQRTIPGSQVVITLDSFFAEHFAIGDPNAEGLLLPMWKWITEGAAAAGGLSEEEWYNDFCRTPLTIDQQKRALAMADRLEKSSARGLEAIEDPKSNPRDRRELEKLLKEMIHTQTEWLEPILAEIPVLFERSGVHPNPGISQDIAGDQKEWRNWYALPEKSSWEFWEGNSVPRQRGYRNQRSAPIWALVRSSQFDLKQEISGGLWEHSLQLHDEDYWLRSVEDGRGVIGLLKKDKDGLYVDSPQPVVRLRSGDTVVDRITGAEFEIVNVQGQGFSTTLRLKDTGSLLVGDEVELAPKPSGATFHPSKVFRLNKQTHWAFSDIEQTPPKPKVDLSKVDRSILARVNDLRVPE